MTNGEYIGSGAGVTKLLLHLNNNSTDSSGNNNNGTDTAITYVDGKFGKCASFNGSSSKIRQGTAITMPTDLTICAWIKKTNNTAEQNIFGDCNATGTIQYIFGQNGQKLRFAWGYASLNYRYYDTDANIIGTDWTFVCVTQVGTAQPIFYVNGLAYSNSLVLSAGANTKPAAQGSALGTFGDQNVWWFNGLIDETIIESRAWTPQEVAKYYTMSRGFYATL